MYVLYCSPVWANQTAFRTNQSTLHSEVPGSTILSFGLMHFLVLSVHIFVLHLSFIIEKSEKLPTGCVNRVIYTLLFKKSENLKILTQLKLNSARQFMTLFIQVSCVKLFCSLQSKLFCIQAK